jgi:hypothetical protein
MAAAAAFGLADEKRLQADTFIDGLRQAVLEARARDSDRTKVVHALSEAAVWVTRR